MKTKFLALAVISTVLSAAPAFAQMMPKAMPKGHMMPAPMTAPANPAAPSPKTDMMTTGTMMSATPNATAMSAPATRAYMEAMAKMHMAMHIQYTGKPSLDFVTAMIPHHRGAIDMAQIALRYSTDAQTLRLARKIITAQQAEIQQMNAIARRLQR